MKHHVLLEDMFSIGAIMCEMLTGWHPFYTPNVDDAQSVQAWVSYSRFASRVGYNSAASNGSGEDRCPEASSAAGRALWYLGHLELDLQFAEVLRRMIRRYWNYGTFNAPKFKAFNG